MRQREDDEWQYALICRVGLLILPPLAHPVDFIRELYTIVPSPLYTIEKIKKGYYYPAPHQNLKDNIIPRLPLLPIGPTETVFC